MLICLSCGKVSSAGSRFCVGCGLSLGARYCEKAGHRNPLSADACRVCGTMDISDGTRALSLSPLSRLLTLVAAVLLWKYALLPYGRQIASGIAVGSLEAGAFLMNTTKGRIIDLLRSVLAIGLILWLWGWWLMLFPEKGGATGRYLRAVPLDVLRFVFLRCLPRLLTAVGGLLLFLLFSSKKAGHGDAWDRSDRLERGGSHDELGNRGSTGGSGNR